MSVSRIFRRGLVRAAIAAAAMAVAAPAAAQPSDSNELKAAIVLNILKFVDFPDDQNTTLELCIQQNVGAARQLRALSGQRTKGRVVRTKIVAGSNFRDCDVVYVPRSSPSAAGLAQANGRLVMGDGARFIDGPGTVGLVRTGGQIRFEINLRQAKADNLKISSRLVRLASRVKR